MATYDFSQYGGPSKEWLAVETALPSTSFDVSADPVTLRETVNAGRAESSAQAMQALAPKVHITTYTIPTRDGSSIQARSYRSVSAPKEAKLPVFLFFHGGGWLFGSLDTEDAACAQHAINANCIVLHANYRHTPEHPFPVAWHDAADSLAWLHANIKILGGDASQVVVGGVSAGGNLAASITLEQHLGVNPMLAGLPAIAGQVLIIPGLASSVTYEETVAKRLPTSGPSSREENANAPVLPAAVVTYFSSLLKVPADVGPKDTKLNVAGAAEEDVRGMPPSVLGIAGLDMLRDEALLYAKTLAEAGVPTEVRLFKGVPHGFRRFGKQLKACEEYDKCTEEGIRWVLGKPKAIGKLDIKVV